MSKDNSNPDSLSRYYKGDIVEVQDDGFIWGTEMSHFYIIKIPDLSKDKVLKYMESEFDLPEDDKERKMTRKRIWNVLMDDIPTLVKTELRDNGEITLTTTQVKNYIKNKITNQIDTEL